MAEAAQIAALEAQLARERERNRMLEAQLRNLADHDPVTDLLNRRTFEREVEEHVARCTRYGPQGALLLIGLEGLDHIAMALGQRTSDEALVAVAEAVRDRLRATDIVGRSGPDELAALLPAGSDVAVVADSLVKVVETTGTAQVAPGSLIASIGVAPVIATPIGARHLLARARQAMVATRYQGGGGWSAAVG